MTSRFFRFFYLYFEVLLELGSGAYALLAPALCLADLAPMFAGSSGGDATAALLLTREFGMLNISFGILQFTMLRDWNRSIVRRFLGAMLLGDVLHLIIAAHFITTNGAFNGANIFNLVLSGVTPFLRAYFVFVVTAKEPAPSSAPEMST